MKKAILKLALCAVAVAATTACSNELSQEEIMKDKLNQMITDGMKPSTEGIQLTACNAAEETASRAPIYNNDNNTGKFFQTDGKTLGIMMLAKDICDDAIKNGAYEEYYYYNNLKVDWTSPKAKKQGDHDDTWSVYLNNVATKADYVKDGAGTIIGTKLNMGLAPTDPKTYYPMGAYHNYWFYGYHPRQENATGKEVIKYSEKQIYVEYNKISGKDDIIWGVGKPASDDINKTYAYSAKYFRYAENRNPVDDTPYPVTMKFEHKCMMVRMHITAGGTPIDLNIEDKDRNYDRAYNTKVQSITIENVPAKMKLIIADNGDETNSGKFEVVGEDRSHECKIAVNQAPKPKADITNPENVFPGTTIAKPDTTMVGEFLLPVLSKEQMKKAPYMVKVVLTYGGIQHSMLVPMRLPVSDSVDPDDYFQAGKMYDVVLKIYNPENINGNAELQQWVEATVSPFVSPEADGTFPIH